MSAEKNVLGAVLGEMVSLNRLDLEASDFTESKKHEALYSLLLNRWAQGLPVAMVSVVGAVLSDGLDECGTAAYISSLADDASPVGVGRYVMEMRSQSQKRKLSQKLLAIHAKLDRGMVDAHAASVEMVTAACDITDLSSTTMDKAADHVIDDLAAVAEGQARAYISSGIPEWDDNPSFIGVSRQGMTILLGRSGMGKTSVVNCMATGMLRKGLKVYAHGTETSTARRLQDMAFSLAEVDGRAWALQTKQLADIREGGGDDLDVRADVEAWYDRVAHQIEWLRSKPLTITGTGLTVEQVCAKARQLHAQGELDVVFIDYIQTLKDSSGLGVRLGDMVQQTGHKSGMLCQLAADLGVPVLITAQVSGEKQGSAPEAPPMFGAQFSSRIHMDAEEVYAIHRPDYFRERDPSAQVAGPKNMVQLVARKRRTGTLSTLNLKWTGATKWVGDRRLLAARPPDRLRLVD